MPAHGPGVPEMRCPDCDSGYIMGGPIWSEPIHDHAFVQGLVQELDKDKDRWGQAAAACHIALGPALACSVCSEARNRC